MKTKKIKKRLKLNKSTISTLGNSDMKRIQGGETPPYLCLSEGLEICYTDNDITCQYISSCGGEVCIC